MKKTETRISGIYHYQLSSNRRLNFEKNDNKKFQFLTRIEISVRCFYIIGLLLRKAIYKMALLNTYERDYSNNSMTKENSNSCRLKSVKLPCAQVIRRVVVDLTLMVAVRL
jgi:hypothetical protein